MLGDSIAFGYGVADDVTFSSRLEERGYEVVNLAAAGYGTDQALIRLEREGMAYRPDVVLLHFCLHNDFTDNASRTYFYDGLHPKPYFTIDGGALVRHDEHLRLAPAARLGLWLHERSHIFNRLAGSRAPEGQEWAARKEAALRDVAAVRDLTWHLIARTAEIAHAGGADFGLIVCSGRREYREGSPWLAALSDAPPLQQIPQVDMGGQFLARGQRFHDVTLDPIGHLSPVGHSEAAVVIDQMLRERVSIRPTRGDPSRQW
jgi:hypothetical protein